MRLVIAAALLAACGSGDPGAIDAALPADAGGVLSRAGKAPGAAKGQQIAKVEPWPGSLRTSSEPLVALAISLTESNPRPVPVLGLVVKKGSKIRRCVA